MYSRYPEYHYILDSSQWPSPVRCLALTLSQPLPPCLTTVESDVSVLTEPSTPVNEPFSRFPSNPAFSPCQRDCSRHLKLKGILDTVLSTAVGLRQLAAQESYGNACPTIPLWYSLMKAIGMASFEGAYVLGEVPFILPRMSPCEASGQHKFDGIATMLVCLSIDKDEYLSSTPPTSLDDIEPKDAIVHKPGSDVEVACAKVCNPIGDIGSVYVSARKPRGEISMELLGLDELDDVSQRDEVESSAHDSDANISIDDESSVDESDENVSMDDESSAGESDEDISVDNESSTEESEGVFMDDESESTSETSVSSIASSIHIPFDAHILPGTGRRYSAMLPLICVADSDNIGMAISSVLYQRRVWGIDEPVVGVSLSRTGTVARVLLGWLDLESNNNEYLPTPHIACADPDSEATTALGVYDLSDPIDALKFSQFITGLDQCFDAIKTYTLNPRIQELPWRSDDVVISKLDDRAHSRVEQWAEEVAMRFPSIPAAELHPPASKSELHTLDLLPEISDMAKKKGSSVTFDEKSMHSSAASSTRSRTREQTSVASEPAASDSGPKVESNPESQAESQAKSRTKSAISSSSLGKRTVGGLTDGLTMTTWLFERNVVGVGCVRIPTSEALTLEEKEINAMIGAYEETTKFAWPKEWKNKDALPAVDPSLTHALATLYREHEEDATPVEELSIPFTSIVSSRLSSLLYATIGAYTLDAESRASGRRVNEAESRHDWDGVLYRFCVNTTEQVISAQILLERNLNFPRNRALDELNKHDADSLFGSFRTLADHNYQLCTAQHAVTSRSPEYNDDADDEAHAAADRGYDFRSQLKTVTSKVMAKYVTLRANAEPRSGICDAIFVASITNPHSANPDSKGAKKEHIVLNKYGLVIIPSEVTSTQGSPNLSPIPETPAEAPRDSQPASVPEALLLSGTLNFQAKWAAMPTPGTRLMPKQRMILDNPLSSANKRLRNTPPVVDPPPPIGLCDLALPIFVVEYKKPDDGTTKALNQARSYAVSCVEFLLRLGIKGHPVFCLVTAGQAGGILLAWRSIHSEKIYIIERNIRTYRLSQPYEALQFAIFLLRLQKWKESLMDKLAGFSVADFVKKAGDGELEWTKTIQVTSVAKAKGQAEAKAKGKAVAKAKGKSGDATLST